jgi:ribosomal protein L21
MVKMQTIVIQTQNAEEAKLVQAFLQQHKIKGHVLTDDDKEDIVLSKLMEETAYDDVVGLDQFLTKLRS